MHPVNFLFEDVYRNVWGIPARAETPRRARFPRERSSIFRKAADKR